MADLKAKIFLFALTSILCIASVSYAAKSKIEVTQDQLISVTAPFGKREKQAQCLDITPGSVRDKSGILYFTPFRVKIRRLRKRSLSNPDLIPRLKKWKKFNRKAKRACSDARELNPTPTPTPTPGPTPVPVFDSNGNVTPEGKVFLGIPTNLNANINAGFNAHEFQGCGDCHSERTNWHYQELEVRLEQDPMYILVPETVSYQELADITAYLNRFVAGVP